jgi:hypothetical protein
MEELPLTSIRAPMARDGIKYADAQPAVKAFLIIEAAANNEHLIVRALDLALKAEHSAALLKDEAGQSNAARNRKRRKSTSRSLATKR